jgi:hypothetical protein
MTYIVYITVFRPSIPVTRVHFPPLTLLSVTFTYTLLLRQEQKDESWKLQKSNSLLEIGAHWTAK